MVKITEQACEAGGLRWFYREALPVKGAGDKVPVVLLHGLVSQSYSWRGVMEPLAANGFRAIAPDWIGHGYSSKPDKREFAYDADAFLEGLDSWLSALEVERFSLVVQGFLGSIGLLYAAKYPERIERLVILNTPLTVDAKVPFKLAQLGWPLLGEVVTQDPSLVDRTLEGGGPYEVGDKELEIYRRPFLKSSDAGRALLATVRSLKLDKTMNLIDKGFKGWSVPTLIAWGTADKWLPISLAERFASRLKSVTLSPLEETGHYAQEDWAQKVSDAVVPFLRRTSVS